MLKLFACSEQETIQLAKELTLQHDKLEQDMLEFIEIVVVYKLPKLTREEIRILLGLNVKLKETRFYQEIAEEERREVLLEGMVIGKIAGESQLLIRQLYKRFGHLPQWVNQKLAGADLEQFEVWAERILDAKTLAEVFE